jgi:hypothetical protein
VLLASAQHELGQIDVASSAQQQLGAAAHQQIVRSSNLGRALPLGSEQQVDPEILKVLQAKGFKGLAPARLRNWHRLAIKINTPGAIITVVTFGGSITGEHAVLQLFTFDMACFAANRCGRAQPGGAFVPASGFNPCSARLVLQDAGSICGTRQVPDVGPVRLVAALLGVVPKTVHSLYTTAVCIKADCSNSWCLTQVFK